MMNFTMKICDLIAVAILMGPLIMSSLNGVMGNFSNGPHGISHADMQAAACGRSAAELFPCLTAVAGAGSKPSSACCSVLKEWGFGCLCDLINENHGNIPGNINTTRVLELPKACGMPVPAGMKCGDLTPLPPAENSISQKEKKNAEMLAPGHE